MLQKLIHNNSTCLKINNFIDLEVYQKFPLIDFSLFKRKVYHFGWGYINASVI